jgi:hypothetical protein
MPLPTSVSNNLDNTDRFIEKDYVRLLVIPKKVTFAGHPNPAVEYEFRIPSRSD